MTACAEYLRIYHDFKRLNMETALKLFHKRSYWFKNKHQIKWFDLQAMYDAIYKVDPEIFINYTLGRLAHSKADHVIWNVRYINEMKALQEAGFVICRVTHNVRRTDIGKYAKNAADGSIPLALQYDKTFAIRHKVDYSVNWTDKASTGTILTPFLESIGYKI